ncbi:MAG: phage tail length tape measure family protein, partial [Thermoleophilia bacterium]|nr:phage tail length tape measure family protein [Thermoleophilia bacterium]
MIAKGDVGDAVRALGKLEKSAGKFSGAFRGHLKTAAMGGAAALVTGLALVTKTGYSEMLEARKVSALTSAALKSTGGASGETLKHIQNLAGGLQSMSGVEDDVIQAGENMLLHFSKVGKKGGVFDRATRAALDYSASTGKPMTAGAQALGRALQNPLKAVGSLKKANVELTDSQQKQIAAFMKHGQTIKAQNVILKAWEKNYKGAAKGAADPAKLAMRAFENMSETMVRTFAPSAAKAAKAAAHVMVQIEKWSQTKQAAQIFDQLSTVLKKFGNVAKTVGAVLLKHHTAVLVVVGAMASLDLAVKGARIGMQAYGTATKVARGAAMAYRMAQWQLAAITNSSTIALARQRVATIATAVASKVVAVATKAWSLAQWALNAAWVANPIGVVIVGIVALAAVLVLAYKKIGWFHRAVDAVFNFVKSHWRIIGTLLFGPIGLAVALITKHWTKIKSVTMSAVSTAIAFVRNHWRLIAAVLFGPLGIAVGQITKHWGRIKSVTMKAVSGTISFVSEHWKLIVAAMINPLGTLVGLVARHFGTIRTTVVNAITKMVASAGRTAKGIGKAIVDGIASGIDRGAGVVYRALERLASKMIKHLTNFLDIRSPSRKMSEKVGKPIAHGVAHGIDKGASKAVRAAKLLADRIVKELAGITNRADFKAANLALQQ